PGRAVVRPQRLPGYTDGTGRYEFERFAHRFHRGTDLLERFRQGEVRWLRVAQLGRVGWHQFRGSPGESKELSGVDELRRHSQAEGRIGRFILWTAAELEGVLMPVAQALGAIGPHHFRRTGGADPVRGESGFLEPGSVAGRTGRQGQKRLALPLGARDWQRAA